MNLTETLLEQITWHWDHQLRPRLGDLSDEEYFWEPVDGCWSVRPRGTSAAPIQAGAGDMTIDFAMPEPDPPPLTTIAWRLGHVIVAVLAMRNATHFGREPTDYQTHVYAGSAADALAQLDTEYARWIAGCGALGDDRLSRPVGAAEGEFAEHSFAGLILHINRELIHHLAEVSLLRDLYASRTAGHDRPSRASAASA
ncbi:MAG: DinB family protein [Labedaea sp.]